MATYYVDGDSGNDANAGTSIAPFKTLNALSVMNSGDTAYLAGLITSHDNKAARITLTGKSNITIRNWEGMPEPRVRGYKVFTGSWTTNGDGTYDATFPSGMTTLSGVVCNWETNINANNQRYGHCRRYGSKAAVQAAASGSRGRFFYDSATGAFTGYFGGANPATLEVAFVCAEDVLSAITLVSCPNARVSGISFGCYPVHTGQFGWAVRLQESPDTMVDNCAALDMGAHAFGTINGSGDGSRCIVYGCFMAGLSPVGTHLIAYQVSAYTPYTGATFSRCAVVVGRWLGLDGLVLDGRGDTVASVADNAQIGAHGHSNGGTTANFTITHCSFLAAETGSRAWAIDDSAGATLGDKSSYKLQVSDSVMTNFEGTNLSPGGGLYRGHWRAERCIFTTNRAALTGFSAGGLMFNIASPNSEDYLYEFHSCVFIGALDGAGATRFFSGQASTGGTKRIRLVNCSLLNTGTSASQFCGFFDCLTEPVKYFEAFGCILGHKTLSADNCIYLWDSATALSGNPIRDCLYYNVTGSRFAYTAGYNATQWVANVDNAATVAVNMLSANPYANEATLEPTAAVYALNRVTSDIAATSGINGAPYAGDFGAWQAAAVGGFRDPRTNDPQRAWIRGR